MPRKFLKRWIPDPHSLKTNARFRFLGALLQDPNLFHLTRHSVSSAFFFGFVVCFMPFPFGQIPLIAVISLWLRCNLPIAIALVMISNPLTFPVIYYSAYLVGCWMLNVPVEAFHFSLSWEWFKDFFLNAWKPFILGNLTFGLTSGGLSYFLIQWLWRKQALSRWQLRKLRTKRTKLPPPDPLP
jgi:uncharacterized protein (DUF2062 family)